MRSGKIPFVPLINILIVEIVMNNATVLLPKLIMRTIITEASLRMIFITLAVFIVFPELKTRFNIHYQNAYANPFRNEFLELLRLSWNSNREYESRGRPCHCATALRKFEPWSRDHVGRASLGGRSEMAGILEG